jgi:hypothetical protein
MPYVIFPKVRKGVIGAAAAALALFGGAGSAAAAACPAQPTTTPFAQWGDTSSYYLLQGGNFESATSGWSLSGAQIVAGSEPFDVTGQPASSSLRVSSGGSATSPVFCLDHTMPYFRFFAREAARGSDLKVSLVIVSSSVKQSTDAVADLADGSAGSWTPTARLSLANKLPVPTSGWVTAKLRFQARGRAGNWRIDDVYVDPYRTA